MAWTDFKFTPEDGLDNTTTFPSKPTNGAAARTQFMTILNQIKAFFNGTVKNTIDEHTADLASQALGKGASLIGINDTDNKFASTNVEGALKELFINVSDGKSVVATAITGKGILTSSSDTFTKMATNINAIETDPSIGKTDAVAGDIIKGKKAVSQGNLLTGTLDLTGDVAPGDVLINKKYYKDNPKQQLVGTMPNRAGDNSALAIARVGTTLKFRAPNGYFDGVDDTVQYTDPNFIASNILSGKSIFGLAGSLVLRKKMASGTVVSGTEFLEVYTDDGYTWYRCFVVVSGLTFTPSRIIVKSRGGGGLHPVVSIYDSSIFGHLSDDGKIISTSFTNGGVTTSNGESRIVRLDGTLCYVTSSGFRLPVQAASSSFEWIAYE